MVVRNMCRQFQLPLNILAHETVRDTDGLSLSSRNMYLQPAERAEAPNLFAALQKVQASIMAGNTDVQALEEQAAEHLSARGWQVDYLSLRRQRDIWRPKADERQRGEPLVVQI